MSDPTPATTPAARKGHGSKYFFLFLLGLVIGIVATVMAVRAIDARKDHFHDSVMHVQQWHLNQLKSNVEQNRCSATDTLPHLEALRTMADDIQPAFPDLRDDKRFTDHASQLRGAVDAARSAPPLTCEGVTKVASTIGETCKACHQDFHN